MVSAMKNNSEMLARSIFFGSLLISGSVLFFAVAAFKVDWFAPSMIFLVAVVLGWDRFMNDPHEGAQIRSNSEEDGVDYLKRSIADDSTAIVKRSFVGESVDYSENLPARSLDLR
jgi:hypothetical protein